MPVTLRIVFTFFAFLLLTGKTFAQTSAFSPTQKTLLTEALRAALVTEKNLPDYASLKNNKEIILLDNMVSIDKLDQPLVYITPELVPDFGDVKLKLMTEHEIKQKKEKKDFLFVRVAQITDSDTDYAVVHVLGQWVIGKKGQKKGLRFKEAWGNTLLFKKENDTWKFQKVINSFPNLIDQAN